MEEKPVFCLDWSTPWNGMHRLHVVLYLILANYIRNNWCIVIFIWLLEERLHKEEKYSHKTLLFTRFVQLEVSRWYRLELRMKPFLIWWKWFPITCRTRKTSGDKTISIIWNGSNLPRGFRIGASIAVPLVNTLSYDIELDQIIPIWSFLCMIIHLYDRKHYSDDVMVSDSCEPVLSGLAGSFCSGSTALSNQSPDTIHYYEMTTEPLDVSTAGVLQFALGSTSCSLLPSSKLLNDDVVVSIEYSHHSSSSCSDWTLLQNVRLVKFHFIYCLISS